MMHLPLLCLQFFCAPNHLAQQPTLHQFPTNLARENTMQSDREKVEANQAERVVLLTIEKNDETQEFQIFLGKTDKPLVEKGFSDFENCYKAAVELQENFDLSEGIKSIPVEQVNAMKALVQRHLKQEQNASSLPN
jgi:hypothetical protein